MDSDGGVIAASSSSSSMVALNQKSIRESYTYLLCA